MQWGSVQARMMNRTVPLPIWALGQKKPRFFECLTLLLTPMALQSRPTDKHATVVHSDIICDVVVTEDPDITVSCGVDKTVVRYDWKGQAVLNRWKLGQTVSKLCYESRMGSGVFAACRDYLVRQFRFDQEAGPVQSFAGHTLPVSDVVIDDESSVLCSGGRDYSVRFWDVTTGKELSSSSESLNVVTCMRWIPGDTTIVQASEDLTLRLWDSRTFSVAQRWSSDKCFPLGVDVSLDGLTIATSHNGFDTDGCYIKLWDRRKGGCVATLTGHSQAAYDCHFLPATSEGVPYLASASKDQSIRIWDPQTGSCLAEETPRDQTTAEIRCLAAARDTRNPIRLFSGGAAGVLHRWHVKDTGEFTCTAQTQQQPLE